MKTVFRLFSQGDPSVGIFGMEATITIEDDFEEHDEKCITDWKTKIQEMYEDEIGLSVYTEEEYKKLIAEENVL
jgi:hypothetical protein